ncbi:MAG: cadmium resistance transporter [Scytonema hyalinum WJT4-NPBG1]|jgi:cadmium resistance protein CadD (predicted permease)|nr:cadmium resistance transporter [Scytonema hyalinum WJT4-NPBG1]
MYDLGLVTGEIKPSLQQSLEQDEVGSDRLPIGDHISIYIPLFASSNFINLLIIIIVFIVMKGLWYAVAYLFARQPRIAHIITYSGKNAVPFILIALGLYLMYERGTFALLSWGQ